MTTAIEKLALSVYPYAYGLFADDDMAAEFVSESLMRFVVSIDVDELDQLEDPGSSLESVCYQLYKLGLEKKEFTRLRGIDSFFTMLPYEARSILFLRMKWDWGIERIARVMKLTSAQVMIDLEQGRGLLYQDEILNNDNQEGHIHE
jgi:DNA-directed RNA polymerase specialized sigma24 family protein